MSKEPADDPLPTHPLVAIWRFWLTHLLGWNDARVLVFAERWRGQILDGNSALYHEEPEYWIAPQIVPNDIRETQPLHVVERLAWAVYPLLVQYRHTYGLTADDLDPLRANVKDVIVKRLHELTAAPGR